MKRIGLMGGTFDPPHLAHLIVGDRCREALSLDEVWYMPAGESPLKKGTVIASVEHRVNMVWLAIQGHPGFKLCRIDVERPAPHYTADTLTLLKCQYPDDEFVFLMGADSLRCFPEWDRPKVIASLCRLAVVRRRGEVLDRHQHDAILPGLGDRITVVDTPMLQVSSTDIRQRLKTGLSVRYLVADSVLEYIKKAGLYG